MTNEMTDKIKPIAIYQTHREIHMVGEYVAVVWNSREVQEKIVRDGKTYFATGHQRDGSPYIDFVAMRTYNEGTDREETVEDEDGPYDGGIESTEDAEGLAADLLKAVAYLRQES